jgi:hypothetical protein
MTISKEERAELRMELSNYVLTGSNAERYIAATANAAPKLLAALDASDERIAGLEAELDKLKGRNCNEELKEAKRRIVELVARANVHADSMIEQLNICSEHKSRIAELEAAAQWRPMDTCPSGEWVFILMPNGRIADLKFHAVEGTDGCWQARNGGLMRGATGDDFVAWLPIPALPEGGAK